MQVAKYTVGISFDINKREWKRLDSQLKLLEKKLKTFSNKLDKTFSLHLNTFKVDQRRLNIALGTALDMASRTTAFEINRFTIDQQRLNRAMAVATRRAATQANATIRPDVNARGDGLGGSRGLARAGAAGGLVARAYAPALALGLGGYGLGATNRRNQEVISAQLTTQAVVEAQGLKGQGPAAFEWLREQGNRIGFNYLDNAQDYNNFLSNSLGAGQTMEQSKDIYLGFSEYQRAMGLTPARQKLVMNALSQMQGKGAVSMEELRRQMAESMPGTMGIFAEAYQKMTGGSATGQESIAALLQAVPTGKVKSSEILPLVAEIMRTRAAPKLDIAMRTSQAQQARFQNIVSDQSIAASKAGIEPGFARLFMALTDSLRESTPMVESMARGFDNVSKFVSATLLSVQSLQRFFQGRDSFLGDKLFPSEEAKSNAFLFMENMKTMLGEMTTLLGNAYTGWVNLLSLLDSSSILEKLNKSLSTISNGMGAINALADGDWSGAKDMATNAGKGFINTVTAPGKAGLEAVNGGLRLLGPNNPFLPQLPTIPSFNINSGLDIKTEQEALRKQAAAQRATAGFPGTVGVMAPGSLDIKMDVQIQAANPEDFNQKFQESFKTIIQGTMLQYSQKE